jgi:hypothetical protein
MEIPVLLRLAWVAQRSVARKVFQIAPLAQTRDRTASPASVDNPFRPSGRLEWIDSLQLRAQRRASYVEKKWVRLLFQAFLVKLL